MIYYRPFIHIILSFIIFALLFVVYKVEMCIRNEWQKTVRGFIFNTSKESAEEFALQKCVAMGFVNHWSCALDRNDLLVTFDKNGDLSFLR